MAANDHGFVYIDNTTRHMVPCLCAPEVIASWLACVAAAPTRCWSQVAQCQSALTFLLVGCLDCFVCRHGDFVSRYKILLPPDKQDIVLSNEQQTRSAVQQLLAVFKVPEGQYEMGRTKVFFKPGGYRHMTQPGTTLTRTCCAVDQGGNKMASIQCVPAVTACWYQPHKHSNTTSAALGRSATSVRPVQKRTAGVAHGSRGPPAHRCRGWHGLLVT